MPRDESNNPTERISRVMAEYETWIKYADELWRHGAAHAPGYFIEGMIPRPRAEEFAREKAFLEVMGRRARYYRKIRRGQRIIRDEAAVTRVQPIDNLANYRKTAQYAITHGYCLQGEAQYTDIEMIVCIMEGVGIQNFLASVRGPNNKRIPIEDLNLEYEGLDTDGANDALQSTREPDNPDPP
jgi:hypothetical protein